MGRDVDAYVQKDITDRVQSHLGDPTVVSDVAARSSAGDFLAILKSPEGVKQAMVVSEILGKPKSMR